MEGRNEHSGIGNAGRISRVRGKMKMEKNENENNG